jgi:hypothetical protein
MRRLFVSLRYYPAAVVAAAMPTPTRASRLPSAPHGVVATRNYPKIGIHPRPADSFVHAMPAHLRGSEPEGGDDLVGMKWVAGFATNNGRGLPAIHALVVLNDPASGVPTAILDGGPITAARTAAVSGVAIRRFGPIIDRPQRTTLIGAGVQGRSHLSVLGTSCPASSSSCSIGNATGVRHSPMRPGGRRGSGRWPWPWTHGPRSNARMSWSRPPRSVPSGRS